MTTSDPLAFVDVDTQHDFMDPSGALYVPDAQAIADTVRRLVAHAAERGIPLFSTADAHGRDDPEFEAFPPHCVKGTAGQEKIEGTLLPDRAVVPTSPELPAAVIRDLLRLPQLIFEKQAYDVFTNPNFAAVLQAAGATRLVLFGVATDYCVRAAALGLLRLGCQVTVVEDAIRGVAPDTTQTALDEMRQAGARFRTADGILG